VKDVMELYTFRPAVKDQSCGGFSR
jgi:hypothetical protein